MSRMKLRPLSGEAARLPWGNIPLTSADLVVANCAQLLTLAGPVPKRKRSLQEVGLQKKAWLASCQGRKNDYLNCLLKRVLPEVKRRNLAEFFDVFCEEGVFSLEETRRLAEGAKRAGLKVRIHADEFSPLGGGELASEIRAYSADHLINVTPEGIRKLARSDTVATLLPGVSFFLMPEKRAPARQLIEEGAIVALAAILAQAMVILLG